ncbi:MAG: endosialidase [Agathobacter sp.]|nr:endosialidase [Agathobacter sp.]
MVVKELLRVETDGTISFGDYTLDAKAKLDNFSHNEALYKVKTYKDITKLECNDLFVYESVPGTAVYNFKKEEGEVSFAVEGVEGAQITLGLEPEAEYEIIVDNEPAGVMSTNLGGKLSLSVEVETENKVAISVKRR